MNELKAKCDAIEKREAERRTIEEKKHAEEIQFLKRTNQQLKVCPCQCPDIVSGRIMAKSPPPPKCLIFPVRYIKCFIGFIYKHDESIVFQFL